MRRRVPAEQPVDDGPAKAHLDAGLGRRMQGVVVAVEAVEERGFEGGLRGVGSGGGRVGGRGEVYGLGTCVGLVWMYVNSLVADASRM